MPVDEVAAGDDRLADFLDLRHTPERAVVIVEGLTALQQVAGSRYTLRAALCLPSRADRVTALVGAEATVLVADRALLEATVGFDLHRGVVAALDRPPPLSVAEVVAGARRLAVVERLNDLENLGALFRNARAFGIDGVVLDPETADPLGRRPVRTSLGHVLRVPFARVPAGEWPVRLPGFTVVALTPAGPVDLAAVELPGPVAFLLGAEGPGLSPAALAAADVRARIPMAPGVDSVNVATAAAIAFAHSFRPEPTPS